MSRFLSEPDVGLGYWTRFIRKLAEREIEEAGRTGFSMGSEAGYRQGCNDMADTCERLIDARATRTPWLI